MLDTLCYAECSLLARNAGLANAAVFVHLSSHIEVREPELHIGGHAECVPLKQSDAAAGYICDADVGYTGRVTLPQRLLQNLTESAGVCWLQCSCVGGHVLTVLAPHTAALTQAPVLCRA